MREIRPAVETYVVPVRAPHPIAVAMASALGRLHGAGINGGAGTIIYGYPSPGTRNKYLGYLNPLQAWKGWNPHSVAGGTIRVTPGSLGASSGNSNAPNQVLDIILRAGGTP